MLFGCLVRARLRDLVLLSLLVVLVACSGDDGEAAVTSTTETTTTTRTQPEGPEVDVLAAYRGFWDAYLEAADPMNPEHPVLQEHAVGAQLQQVTGAFLARLDAGEVIRGELDLAPVVVSLNDTTATVSDCYLDRTGVYDAVTGERHDTESGVRHLVTVELVFEGGRWKVTSTSREGDGCTPEASS